MMLRVYPTQVEATAAEVAVSDNMRGLALSRGYTVQGRTIIGKIEGVDDLGAVGTTHWADVIACQVDGLLMWGYPDPYEVRLEDASVLMAGVPPGEVIEFVDGVS